jgi:glycosyltransferase involved in cell wall biosynthesis
VFITGSTGTQSIDAAKLSVAAREESTDIFHLVGTNALVFSPICKLLRARGKIIRHVFTPYDAKDRAARPLRWVANRLFIDSYAFTSSRLGSWAMEVPIERRFLLRPPVDCSFYRPLDHLDEDHELRGVDKPLVLYMGPLMPSRFPREVVLNALKRLVKRGIDPRLVVMTSANRTSTEECERVLSLGSDLSLAKNLIVKRVDLTEQERILWYNRADVVIFPYVGPEPEKLADPPFGILESMACGRVVLATDVLSVGEVVEDGVNGFLMSKAAPEDLERGLIRAMGTSEKKAIQRNARKRIVERFDYPRIQEDVLKAYTSTLG